MTTNTTKDKKITKARVNKKSWIKYWNEYFVYVVEFILGFITLLAAILFILSLSTLIKTLITSGIIIISSASFIAFIICSIWLGLMGYMIIKNT